MTTFALSQYVTDGCMYIVIYSSRVEVLEELLEQVSRPGSECNTNAAKVLASWRRSPLSVTRARGAAFNVLTQVPLYKQ